VSRAKRVRKARMAARREKRLTAGLRRSRAFLIEANERARFRRELNASDLPDATKTVLGFLADPVGYALETAARAVQRQAIVHIFPDKLSFSRIVEDENGNAKVITGGTGFNTPPMCDLCIDPIDKPHIDEDGTKRWRACPNPATREVLDDSGRDLNVCEEHFRKAAQ
jgi:hypothetical protein